MRAARTRVAEPVLALLAGSGGTGEVATAFAATGLSADTELRVLLVRAADARFGVELLDDLLAENPAPVFLGVVGDDAWALVAVDGPWPGDWTTEAREAASTLGRGRVLIGAGGPATVAGLRGAAEEARYAVEAAARRPERVAVVSGEEIDPHRLLLAGAPDALRLALRRRVLGPLPDHPELLRTVRVFLDHSASVARTARALHVHVNTVRYRLARAGELLGADLTDFRTRVDLYLALSVDP